MSTLLFHGPTSRDAAMKKADEIGRLVAPPFGDEGLKVDTAREIVERLSTTPIGDAIGVVIVGPFDEVTVEASDALLKLLEEFDPRYIQPILWAGDIESVSGTIRSRCLATWCPAPEGYSPEAPFLGLARSLCEAALRRRVASIIETLAENKGQEDSLLRASCEVLATEESWPLRSRLILWEQIREVLRATRGNPSPLAALTAYLV